MGESLGGALGGPPGAQSQSGPKGEEVVITVDDVAAGSEDRPAEDVVQLLQKLARSSSGRSLEGLLWQAYLHDVVRSSLGLVAAEVWMDIDRGAGVTLQRAAYFIDPAFEDLEAAGVNARGLAALAQGSLLSSVSLAATLACVLDRHFGAAAPKWRSRTHASVAARDTDERRLPWARAARPRALTPAASRSSKAGSMKYAAR